MAAGVKLYHQFKELINETGEIKMAWFTSFNFSISFFEKYVLSALVKMDSFDLRTLKDFEALNDRIVNSANGGIDVRVFHDYRASVPDVKKTSIQTYGINPKDLGSKFANGVFHPKVGLIVNENNEAWLVTGSANLSISAWSNNSEGVVFKKLEDKENAQAITSFFLELLPKSSNTEMLLEANKVWQKKLKTNSNWQFINSFSDTSFLSQLKLDQTKSLHVWSPYFSDDVSSLIDEEIKGVEKVNIIPDFTPADSVRISPDTLLKLSENKRVDFLKDNFIFGVEGVLVHAKVWLTDTVLGIGSWNFTKAGLNLSAVANNIEAGVVINLSTEEHRSFLGSCNFSKVAAPNGMSPDSLEEDRKTLLYDWKMTCQIYADWDSYTYSLETDEDIDSKAYYIDLPGKKARIKLSDLRYFGSSFYTEYKHLLKDRLFTVYDALKEGNKVYMGVIIEINPKDRPAVGFKSIDELLRAWTDSKPEAKTQNHESNYEMDTETGEELSEQIAKALKGDYSNAWFTMFLAFEQMTERIKESAKDARELKMIGYNIPGSVSQLSEHLSKLKESIGKTELEMSESFIWFMINEGNLVIEHFNGTFKEKDMPQIPSIDNITLDFNTVDNGQMSQWLAYIKQECGYVKE